MNLKGISLDSHTTNSRNYAKEVEINVPEEELIKWKKALLIDTICPINEEELQSKDNENCLEDLKTIHFDAERTRVPQTRAYPTFKSDLKSILVYYCAHNDIKYKQGLNEILAPFLILHFLYPHRLTKVEAYLMFKEFVNTFIFTFIAERHFFLFRQSLQFYQLLQRYHNPALFAFFEKMSVIPEMYAMSWLLTVFAGRISLDLVYPLWSYFISINDSLFPYYLLISLFLENNDKLLKTDSINVISMFCSVTIDSIGQLQVLISKANQLKADTPYSFKLKVDSIGMFNAKLTLKRTKDFECIPLMPTLAFELCHLTLPDVFKCPNSSCPSFSKFKSLSNIIDTTKLEQCWICNSKANDSKTATIDSYIILDIRDSRQLESCGLITKSIFIKEEQLNDKDKEAAICQMLSNEKGKYKFIILISKTSYIDSYEKGWKADEDGLAASRTARITINTTTKDNARNQRMNPLFPSKKQKEFINFKRLINLLTVKNNFPYVSYCYGGFEEVHKLFLQYNVPIVLHTYSLCLLCNKNRPKAKGRKSFSSQKNRLNLIEGNSLPSSKDQLAQKKEKPNTVTMNEISDIIASNGSQVYFGILLQSKEKTLGINCQLFISLNENVLTLYIKDNSLVNSDSFTLLRQEPLDHIAFARRDLNAKNLLLLSVFNKDSKDPHGEISNFLIDFTSIEECRRFLVDLKEYGSLKQEKLNGK